MEHLREKLRDHITYEEGVKIRKQLRAWGIENYKQRYTDAEHMSFIKRHEVSTEVIHPQSTNYPYYYSMFSVCTQHIVADTIEELFDKALDIEKK